MYQVTSKHLVVLNLQHDLSLLKGDCTYYTTPYVLYFRANTKISLVQYLYSTGLYGTQVLPILYVLFTSLLQTVWGLRKVGSSTWVMTCGFVPDVFISNTPRIMNFYTINDVVLLNTTPCSNSNYFTFQSAANHDSDNGWAQSHDDRTTRHWPHNISTISHCKAKMWNLILYIDFQSQTVRRNWS